MAILEGYRLLINSRGVATIVKGPGSCVYGLLWSILPDNERALDLYEGVSAGVYAKKQVVVMPVSAAAELVPAMVYIASDSRPGAARAVYLSGIIHATERYGYPEEYVNELKRLE